MKKSTSFDLKKLLRNFSKFEIIQTDELNNPTRIIQKGYNFFSSTISNLCNAQ